MKRSFFFIATVSLTAGLSIGCCAQERVTVDTTQISREEWQAKVKASRERLDLRRQELTRERNKQIDPRREELTRERNKQIDPRREEAGARAQQKNRSDAARAQKHGSAAAYTG